MLKLLKSPHWHQHEIRASFSLTLTLAQASSTLEDAAGVPLVMSGGPASPVWGMVKGLVTTGVQGQPPPPQGPGLPFLRKDTEAGEPARPPHQWPDPGRFWLCKSETETPPVPSQRWETGVEGTRHELEEGAATSVSSTDTSQVEQGTAIEQGSSASGA